MGSVMAVIVVRGFREDEDANVRYRKDDIRVIMAHGYLRIMVYSQHRLKRAELIGKGVGAVVKVAEGRSRGWQHGRDMDEKLNE